MDEQKTAFLSHKPALSGPIELLNKSLDIYKNNFEVIFGILAIPFLLRIFSSFFGGMGQGNPKEIAISALLSSAFAIAAVIFNLLATLAVFYVIKERDRKIGIGEALSLASKKLMSYFWVSFLVGFITFGGFGLFIVPGIIFSLWFSLSFVILVVENLKGRDALLRSKQLTGGNLAGIFWRGLVIIFMVIAVQIFFSIVIAGPITFINKFAGEIIYSVISVLFAPLLLIYPYLIYEDLRKIKSDVLYDPAKERPKFTKFIVIGVIGTIAFLVIMTIFLGVLIMATVKMLETPGNPLEQIFKSFTPTSTDLQNYQLPDSGTYQ